MVALCQYAFGSVFVTVFALPLKYLPEKSIRSATGMINFGGQIAGVIAPTLIGYMITLFNGSYNVAFWLLIGAAFVSVMVGVTLNTRRQTDSGQEKVRIFSN